MAAAFAALVSLQNNLHLTYNHPLHSFSFEDKQIQSLWQSVGFLMAFMQGYVNPDGVGQEALERRIAKAAQAAEDVVESHVVDQIHGGKTRGSKTSSSPRYFLDLQKVIEDMDYMRRKAFNIYSRSGTEWELPVNSATSSTPPRHISNKTTTMVGFDGELLQLLDRLTGVPSSRRVIPIVGMGGIGKTTLATNAFQHPLIVERFDICLWATISQQYKVEKILTQLLSVDDSTPTVDELGERLYKSLCGQRYLIVLDDMWSLEAWDEIKYFFPSIDNGSRVVVTTRHVGVADHFGFSWLSVSLMDEETSWDLFCHKAFGGQVCPPELEEIGKKIVEKCRGLPLAIVVVGGHLRNSSMALEYWENVAHHIKSILNSTDNEEQCLNVLSLSYSYLPPRLKPCFLLLKAFLEDDLIYSWNVIKLWIAEGFIEAFENTRLEVVAHHYLFELYERNLILVDQMNYNGDIHKFKLHDLVRELCIKIAKKEEFLYVFDAPRAINRERRVVIRGDFPPENHQTETLVAPIRCLICEGGRLTHDHLKLLRVLNKVDGASTSDPIFQQVNLRYLDLEYQSLYLPPTISLLWNLQILVITVANNQSTVIAPYEIWEMLQLRHLEAIRIYLVDPLPMEKSDDESNDFVLRNLHTVFDLENFRLSDEVCKRIPNVRKFQLSYCDEASNWYYCPQNLGCFHELEYLVLKFDGDTKWRDFALSLTFPASLKLLCLSGCGVDWEELTVMVGSLPNLASLRLYEHSVVGSVWTPVEGRFLSLKHLEIHDCGDLIYWNADSFHFPVLTHLLLKNLSKLDEFPSGIGEIQTLKLFMLDSCSISSTISAMRTVVEQVEQGNEDLELTVTFQGDEETLETFNKMVQDEGLESNNLLLNLQSATS